MRILPLLLFYVILLGCASTQQEQKIPPKVNLTLPVTYAWPESQTFKVLSWNVEHFVDPFDDPYIDNRRENYPDSSMTQSKVQGLITTIRKANADIVVLQEFESAKYLERLAKDSLPEMGYRFFADAPSRTWYMNVAIMSRYPLGVMYGYHEVYTPVEDWENDEGHTETQHHINTRMWTTEVFTSQENRIYLTGLHLKAGRGERNEGMRKGQIRFLKQQFERFIEEDPQSSLLVLGDLNAYPTSEEIQLLKSSNSESTKFIDPLDTTIMTHTADNPRRRLDYMSLTPR